MLKNTQLYHFMLLYARLHNFTLLYTTLLYLGTSLSPCYKVSVVYITSENFMKTYTKSYLKQILCKTLKTLQTGCCINPFMPNGLFYLHPSDRSVFKIRGVWLLLSINMFYRILVLHANSLDPNQMPHSAASDLILHCLLMSLLWDARLKRVNVYLEFYFIINFYFYHYYYYFFFVSGLFI